jgi:hypothetical protein
MKKNYSRPQIETFGAVESLTQTPVGGSSHPIMFS